MTESAVSAPTRPKRAPIRKVFRHRNYRLFFAGQLLSLMGSWMQIIAQGWLVTRLAGAELAPLMLGMVGFLQQGPVFFLSALGGTLADRVDRRKVIIATQIGFLIQATTLAFLTLSGLVQIWEVATLALCFGLLNAVDVPTRQSFTVEMVGRDDLQAAVALNSIMFNMARVVGPAVAGITILAVGEGWCFAINAVSYVAVLTSLFMMQTAWTKPVEPKHPLHELAEGFRYVSRHREIRSALLALALTSFAGGPYLTMMPVFASQVLHTNESGYGLLMTTVGCGALCGAFAMSWLRQEHLRLAPSVAAIAFGLSMTALALSREVWVAMVLIVPTAFSLMMQGSTTNVLIQNLVEDRMRGRVMAYFTMSFLGMMPFGSLTAGLVAHFIGVGPTLCGGGLVCAVGGAVVYWMRHRVHRPLVDAP